MVVYHLKNRDKPFHLWPSKGVGEGGERGGRDDTIATPVGEVCDGFYTPGNVSIPHLLSLPLTGQITISKGTRVFRSLGPILRMTAVDTEKIPQVV